MLNSTSTEPNSLMIPKHDRYIFAPEEVLKSLGESSQVHYGWLWDNISIVVGLLPSEVVHPRLQEFDRSNLQLTGKKPIPLPPLVVFSDASLWKTSASDQSQIWITYKTPNLRAQRFYTVKPLELDLVPKSGASHSGSVLSQLGAVLAANPARLKRPGGEETPSMDVILDYVNIAPVVDQLVRGSLVSSPLLAPGEQPSPSSPAAVLVPQKQGSLSGLVKIITVPFVFLGALCNTPIPLSYSGTTLAKDISATLQQMDVRLEQTMNGKEQFEATKLENVQSIAQSTARYINFFNCVWLIVNDVIIGTAAGGFICDNKDPLARMSLELIQRYSIDLLRDTLHWLDNWPVGLKLNTELSSFLCNSFSMAIDYWSYSIQTAAPYFPTLLYCVGCSGVFGMAMILSLLSDILSVLTFHTYVCYLVATTAFARLLKLLGSLYNLFRGKRKNILRNRTDAWNYDMDQLLLGTILFTLVAFLLPTVTVYYLLFTLTRLGIIAIQASLETVLAFLNHFPLFALMLRVKDPARLPGGIVLHFGVNRQPNARSNFRLLNKPIPYSRIFFQHLTVWSRLSSHYSPLRLLRCLLTGAFITPISRYSIRFKLPAPKLGSKIKSV